MDISELVSKRLEVKGRQTRELFRLALLCHTRIMRISSNKILTYIFLLSYLFIALGKMQANLELPYWDNDIFYAAYCCLLMVFALFYLMKKTIEKSHFVKTILFITVYVLLWGYVFTNPRYQELISENAYKMLFFIVFISTTAFWVNRLNCFKDFLMVTYVAQVAFIIFCFICFKESGDWITNLKGFFIGGAKQKIGYGGNANIMGSLCYATFVIGSFLNEFLNKKKYINIVNLFVIFVLLTTSARVAIICTVCYLLVLILFKLYKKKPNVFFRVAKKSWVLLVVTVIIVLLNPDYFSKLLYSMNRYYTVSNNMLALKMSNRWVIGLGYINYGEMVNFLATYGIPLTYSESWYIDVLVTTGILGSAWMIAFYFMFIKGILKSGYLDNNQKTLKIIAMYLGFVLYGAVEPVGFADAYWISFIMMTIGFCLMIKTKKNLA